MSSSDWTKIWPNKARAAIAVTLDNMGEAADLDRGLWPDSEPIGSHFSVTEVLPKILALLRKYDIKATYFIEASNLAIYPEAVAHDLLGSGHELAWHAWRHEAWHRLSEDEEIENFDRSSKAMAEFTAVGGLGHGKTERYLGFRPPGGITHGERTLNLCQKYGLEYISPAGQNAAIVSLNEDQSSMVILPFRWSTVDAYYYMEAFSALRKMKGEIPSEVQTPDILESKYIEQIDQAIEEGGYLSLLFHPFLSAEPGRLEALERVLQHLSLRRQEGKIWLARCCDIQQCLRENPKGLSNDPGWDLSQWR